MNRTVLALVAMEAFALGYAAMTWWLLHRPVMPVPPAWT